MVNVLEHAHRPLDRFVDRILALLDGKVCRNCHQRMALHAIWGEACPEGNGYSKTQRFAEVEHE